MSYNFKKPNDLYGLGQGLVLGAPRPIIATRAPTTSDFAELGSLWVNKTTGTAYYITRVVANSATWSVAASTTAAALAVGTSLTVGTTATIGTGLTVTAGGATITAGNFVVTAGNISTGAGSISAATTVTAGTGVTATTGGVTATAGNIVATAGNISTTAGSITSATSLTATLGNITATHGDIVCSTATHGITLPGPVRIITGAGAPAAGLAVNVGDLYIRTDAGGVAERMYICTVAGTFTTVTCAA
jgi:hypothetical protein